MYDKKQISLKPHVIDNNPKKSNQESLFQLLKKGWIRENRAAVQCYIQTPAGYKFSENNKYATFDRCKSWLFVNKNGGALPRPKDFFLPVEQNECWIKYIPNSTLIPEDKADMTTGNYPENLLLGYGPNDCGYYAGALAGDKKSWSTGDIFRGMKDKQTGKTIFREPHDTALTDQREGAAPEIGESYFIWPPSGVRLSYRGAVHHVATVVAKDGADRITSEADCGEKRVVPYFEMYGTKNTTPQEKEQTFLYRNCSYFNSADTNEEYLRDPEHPGKLGYTWKSTYSKKPDARVGVLKV